MGFGGAPFVAWRQQSLHKRQLALRSLFDLPVLHYFTSHDASR